MRRATICQTIDPPWTSLEPIILGRASAREGTPNRYVLVEGDDGTRQRCDIHVWEPECFLYEEALVWNDLLVVGFGSKAYCAELNTRATHIYSFGYFQSLHAAADYCLICSDQDIIRLNADGTIRWRNAAVALDGVVISTIEGNVISGQGEWDPPGGWSDFEIDLSTGEFIVRPNQWPTKP